VSERSEPVHVTEETVERLADHAGVQIPAPSRAAVAQHLAGLLMNVRLVEAFVVPETTEPAPTFQP